ncbi:sigma-54-dependent transcriptional regulator [Kordiimonas pumila]|uniref:DNA-binding transcriptional regulator NtrC n=1 Tax=Kordiimonas pumila TaxID=2161677 RepID=A0ABV7D658_9PROT|nr:sigma-54 dependent transcriptional regulator [Kordiimonas pumila]
MNEKRILIVEDELTQITLLEGIIKKAGYSVETATSGKIATQRILNTNAPALDVILLDLMMPEMNGIEVLQAIRPSLPNLPVIMLTAHSSISTVVDAMRAGANDFIVKPASAERIRTALDAAIKTTSFVGEITGVSDKGGSINFDSMVGKSAGIKHAIKLSRKAATATIPVLIEGESGVGKEVFAHAIHAASDRKNKPFVAVNCGAIPENLVESILFGHEKGSFTGATEKRIGKFQEAHGGTLFLDEVGELPLDIQVKLLRAIQEKEIDPVGGKQSTQVDIRIISATNRNLAERVSDGAFREDLFYRLNVYPVLLPPLRNRKDDIRDLAEYFLSQISEMEGLPKCSLSEAAVTAIIEYDWPGNIRQLQNALFRAVILTDHETLQPQDFPHLMIEGSIQPSAPVAFLPSTAFKGPQEDVYLSLHNTDGHIRNLADLEKDIIKAALGRYEGKMTEVAKRLKIGRSTLYRKLEEYGLGK